jgi:hypothetical protein
MIRCQPLFIALVLKRGSKRSGKDGTKLLDEWG